MNNTITDILNLLFENEEDCFYIELFEDYYNNSREYYYSEIAKFVYKSEESGFINQKIFGIIGKLNKNTDGDLILNLERLYEHINLELIRKLNVDKISKEYEEKNLRILSETKKIEERINELSENEIGKVEKNISNVKKDMKNHKFDVIALTTLIFTAFTVISINASIFGSTILKSVSIKSVIGMMAATNLIVILTVYVIYSIIRKIHGDIDSKELNTNLLMAGLFLLFLSFVGLC